jgi:hypothetical protein
MLNTTSRLAQLAICLHCPEEPASGTVPVFARIVPNTNHLQLLWYAFAADRGLVEMITTIEEVSLLWQFIDWTESELMELVQDIATLTHWQCPIKRIHATPEAVLVGTWKEKQGPAVYAIASSGDVQFVYFAYGADGVAEKQRIPPPK